MQSIHVKAPVRAVKYLRNGELVYGFGDRLNFKGSEIKIPGSERIIATNPGKDDNLFVTTEFKLFLFKDAQLSLISMPTRDRILAVLEEEDDSKLWIVQARGTVHLYQNYKFIKSFSLRESSGIFYSASIYRRKDSKIEIAFGTIFSGILITHIDESSSFIQSDYNLEGHKGSIIDIKHHPQDGETVLVSCSDDRSVRIWKREFDNNFKCEFVCLAHEARVWAIDICKDKIASVSEDNTCRIWDIDSGKQVKCIEHDSNSKSIWSVSFSENAQKVAVGSNDGSVMIHKTSTSENIKQYHVDYDIKVKNFVVTHKGDVYYTNSGGQLICLTKSKDSPFTAKIDGIKKSSVMIATSKHLYLADDSGNVYVKDTEVVEANVQKLNFKLPNKIIKMFVSETDILLMETVADEVYIFDSDTVKLLEIEKQCKVTSFQNFENHYLIGTRQGCLLIFDEKLLPRFEIDISEYESLKSIKFKNNGIHVIDRVGIESVLSDSYLMNTERKIAVSSGAVESYMGDSLVSSFHQQYFVITNPETGIAELKIFCGGGHRLWSSAFKNNEFAFAYVSNGKFNLFHGRLDLTEVVSSKSHGKEIRCAHRSNEMVFSGSEDGLVLLHKGTDVISSTRLSNTSIKCITSALSGRLCFIGGSNETIEAYELDPDFSFIHRETCCKQIEDVETRVLCMDTFHSVNEKESIILFVGYSDASIRVFDYRIEGNHFYMLTEIKRVHSNRCVQQLKVVSGAKSGEIKFITAGADGYIQSWTFKATAFGIIESIKFLWSLSVHCSGINGLDIQTSVDCGDKIRILTGGEDGSVVLTEIIRDKVSKITTRQAHNSTVTGVKFYGDLLLSSSIDRHIVLCDSENEGVKQIKRTIISDISALTIGSSDILSVYGSGIESFRIEQ